MKLKVMALGRLLTLKRLSSSMSNEGIDLVGISGMSEAFTRLEEERFDVILIDSLIYSLNEVCQYICKIACAPIALLFSESEANWQTLGSLEVDGFVPAESSQNELVSRIKAISRRRTRNYHAQINYFESQ